MIPRKVVFTYFLRSTNKATLAERITQFADYHLNPLVQIFHSLIKDPNHFLLQLRKLGSVPDNSLLITLDVSSLYTSIPHNEGVDACRYFPNTRYDKSLHAENICDLIRIILTINNFPSPRNIICKNTEQLWEPAWHLRTPIYSWVKLSNKPLIALYSSRPLGGGSSMISS